MTALREALARGFVAAPGVHDGFSALLSERLPFQALYMSGYCIAASRFGLPDAGLIGLGEMLQGVELIRRCTTRPLIADADTGYGGLLNVQHTVRRYEAAGAAAIQIEDQETPKKCGHTRGKRVIDALEMTAKVEIAVETRRDMLVIARTDALATHGVDEAIARCRLYRAAGADIVFVDALDGEGAMRRVGGELGGDGPVMINMTPPSRDFLTPQAHAATLQAWGFALAIYPGLFANPALAAMEAAGRAFLETGLQLHADPQARLGGHDLVGFPAVWADEARWQARFGSAPALAAE